MLHIDFFVFVDADVDPLDPRAVLTTIALDADPDTDFHQFGVERMPKVPLNIYQTPDEKGSADGNLESQDGESLHRRDR